MRASRITQICLAAATLAAGGVSSLGLALLAGFLSVSPVPAVAQPREFPPDVSKLLSDPKLCWEREAATYEQPILSGKGLAKKLEETAGTLRASVNRGTPGETFIDVYKSYLDAGIRRRTRILYRKVPCPPTTQAGSGAVSTGTFTPEEQQRILQGKSFDGLDVGGFVSGGTDQNNFTERLAATNALLEQNSLGASAQIGGGGHIGFVTPLFNNVPFGSRNLVVPIVGEPFIEIGDSNQKSKIDFGNGASLSANSNFSATGGINLGPVFRSTDGGRTWVRLTVGASVQNETFNFNFIPTASSGSKTVFGFTTGFGIAFMPDGLQVGGLPVMLSVDYRHTAWQTVTVPMPAAAPGTNFDFKGSSDEVRFGMAIIFGGPPGTYFDPKKRFY